MQPARLGGVGSSAAEWWGLAHVVWHSGGYGASAAVVAAGRRVCGCAGCCVTKLCASGDSGLRVVRVGACVGGQKYRKAHSVSSMKANPLGGACMAKGIVLEKVYVGEFCVRVAAWSM